MQDNASACSDLSSSSSSRASIDSLDLASGLFGLIFTYLLQNDLRDEKVAENSMQQ